MATSLQAEIVCPRSPGSSLPLPARPRVVVVDNSPELLDVVCAVLQSQYEAEVVGQAADGGEALHVVAMLRPDLVIMDVHMPKVDGFVAASMISRRYPGTAVVLMSGDETPELRAQAERCGAQGFVFKPNLAREFAGLFWPQRRDFLYPPRA